MKRLLLVDDHRIFRETLATCLDSEYVVFTASTGIEALELLEIQDIDIMLLDVEMPEMNGIDTLRTLRKRNSTLPVIILTQFDEEYLMIHLLSLGANAFLSKDCGLNELRSAIAETLRTGKPVH